ncbi:uncharacterized protein LOC129958168 [Argiope bruennichi]|uniref:Uncharacterized protein n=1 Tax=Argiope bruennichi TaxID=94029 RepID=A0A8T0F5V3_ARGBR|nr:uncharacterized protein LOC129958168 [Argiope bruennichi]KAF8784403.1 hypothetical protein HNY73_010083 [Argiope bruennichi]
MVVPFLWLLLNGLGVYAESSIIPTTHLSDDPLGYKWWIPLDSYQTEEMQKRSKRLILSRQEDLLSTPNIEPTVQTPLLTKKKGNRNSRKKNVGNGKDEFDKIFLGANKKLKKQGKMKKPNPIFLRQGQSPKRLRQHMQHKKKVKQFLQKRIQEQIQQRHQNLQFTYTKSSSASK